MTPCPADKVFCIVPEANGILYLLVECCSALSPVFLELVQTLVVKRDKSNLFPM